jgi:hypothetical protein
VHWTKKTALLNGWTISNLSLFVMLKYTQLFIALGLALAVCLVVPATVQPAAGSSPLASSLTVTQQLAILMQVTHNIGENITNKDLSVIHTEDMLIRPAYIGLLQETMRPSIPNFDQFKPALIRFVGLVSGMHTAADAFDQGALERQMPDVLKAFDIVQGFFPAATRAAATILATKHTCPMHPAIIGKRSDSCPKCGMELEQIVRVLPPQSAPSQTVRASIRTDAPLQVDKPATGYLKLSRSSDEPVLISDLIEIHTEKIHLLIIDPSLSDYHHVHPRAGVIPGEYTFTFTPRRKGPYRAWADLRPYPSGLQEYAMAEILGEGVASTLTDKSETTQSTAGELHFELVHDDRAIKAGKPARARLRVSTTAGVPFNKLEPVMGTFAHLVGFNEDFQTVLHMHPIGPPILKSDLRGGPELEFNIYSLQPGFYRLFAQVQVGGQSLFAPFGLKITE